MYKLERKVLEKAQKLISNCILFSSREYMWKKNTFFKFKVVHDT